MAKENIQNQNQQFAEVPVTFRVEKEIQDYIQDVMIERREFNKSKIQREIFMLGLELFKKKQKK